MVADRLCAEFTGPETTPPTETRATAVTKGGMVESLDPEDEALVDRLREALVGIASTLRSVDVEPPVRATETALDATEFVIRRALAGDESERVLELFPSFVFLVALTLADQNRALELSEQTAGLAGEFAPRAD